MVRTTEGTIGSTEADAPLDDSLPGSRRNGRDREDEWADGSYRDPSDPEGVRRTADGEAMIQNKDGTWRPVSQMADPNRTGGDDGRRHNPQVGRWVETEADRYAQSQGWERLKGPPTTMESGFTGPQRVDAIYHNRNPPPGPYIVSDAKGLNSPQRPTKDGLQMSRNWIERRLARSGLSTDELDEVMDGYDPVILRVDKNGNVTEEWLDENGSVVSHTGRDE